MTTIYQKYMNVKYKINGLIDENKPLVLLFAGTYNLSIFPHNNHINITAENKKDKRKLWKKVKSGGNTDYESNRNCPPDR